MKKATRKGERIWWRNEMSGPIDFKKESELLSILLEGEDLNERTRVLEDFARSIAQRSTKELVEALESTGKLYSFGCAGMVKDALQINRKVEAVLESARRMA